MATDDHVDPDALERAGFELVRRGFDPVPVQQRLRDAAAAIRSLRRERDGLRGQLAEVGELERLEPHRIAEALGVEATQVLEAAHDAAVERAARAEREAQAVREEAIAAAELIRAEAKEQREEQLVEARLEAAKVAEGGRIHGRDMVNEAQVVRERMLGDLARKRQTGRAQVEQLRAGRDRLLDSLTVAQQSLDTAVRDLVESVPEARAAAERAGMRIAKEVQPTVEHLEAEIEVARLVGHPLVEDIRSSGLDPAFVSAEMEVLTHSDVTLDAQESKPELEGDGAELFDAGDEEEAAEEEAGDEEEAAVMVASPADDIFARLRESAVPDPEPVSEPDPEPVSEPDPEPVSEPEAAVEPEADPLAEARDRAVSQAARALKKVLVDEQGTLLDGIRRSGAEAVAVVVADADDHAAPYENAAQPALHEFAESQGATKDPNFDVAYELLRIVALDPVRQRLIEVAEHSDDPDELSKAVRGLYRESRSRRLPEAAQTLVVAAEGATALALAEGFVEWRIDPDGDCGADCADNALAGAVVVGEAFPTGHVHPPTNSTCTCRLVATNP